MTGIEVREAMVVTATGEEVPTIVAKQVVRRADGTIDGLIGTVTDVTQIKLLERELARRREQLDLVIRSSQQGILDLELKENGAAYYSERFHEILGFVPGTFPAGFNWEEWIFADDISTFRQRLAQHFRRESPNFDVECRACRASGGLMWLRVRGIAQFDEEGRAQRFVGSIVDTTKRREAELQLIEANVRVTEAARAKESFLATMSHEIRTPMNGVLGMAGLLADTQLNDEQRDYIRLIRASGDTLLRLIDDVLDFSKIESGRMTLEAVTVELVSVIEEAFELVAEKALEKKIALVYDLRDDLPSYIVGDATRLRQILLNLLSNAIKFTDEGEIVLRMRCDSLPDDRIRLSAALSDTGIGIPADRVQKLFEPFTQVDASTTRKYGGTGLGLAIVKRLVTTMGGEVAIDSVEGRGSTFRFSIVTHRVNGPQRPYMQNAVPEFSGKRILLIDANVARRDAAQYRYQQWGFDVIALAPDCAEHIKTAMLGVAESAIDIFITDSVATAPLADSLTATLVQSDRQRTDAARGRVVVILMSSVSRAELSLQPGLKLMRHDMFVMRPAGRTRMFEVLNQAATGKLTTEVATRPFMPEPIYDTEYTNAKRGKRAPSTKPPNATALPSSPSPLPEGALNILVAEDNEVNQRVIEGMLRRLGHRAVLVADGQAAVDEAIRVLSSNSGALDIILMDIHMPVLDGVAATREIKRRFESTLASEKLPRVPIVAMTAHALAGDREYYLGEGLDDYISKPIRREDLVALLARCVPDKRSISANTGAALTTATARAAAQQLPASAETTDAADAGGLCPDLSATPILDIEQLEDVRGEPTDAGDPAPGSDLIALFRDTSQERLRRMAACLVDSNWLLLGDIAHSLRGASASIGFPRVAAACKALELATRRLAPKPGVPPTQSDAPPPTQAQLDQLYEAIKRHSYEAEHALNKWLDSPSATQ